MDVWSKDQRIHQDGNFHKSLGRYLQRRSLNSCLVRLACLLGRKMMEDDADDDNDADDDDD